MRTILKFTFLLLSVNSFATNTIREQLTQFNPNWENFMNYLPEGEAIEFEHDWQLVQFHLIHVIGALEDADLSDLTASQKNNRKYLIHQLRDYCTTGRFPINTEKLSRTPVFIDEASTRCAVGHLLDASGHETLTLSLAKTQNLNWVKDIQSTELMGLQKISGLSLAEIKLIQGAYDFYMPNGLYASNKFDIPQQPQIITKSFNERVDRTLYNRSSGIWLLGEEKNGELHGQWIQNYSSDLPWIVGYYNQGKRSGQWKEYYKGTDILCRTEYWRNDKLNGIRTRFDRLGNIIEKIQFKDGMAVLKTNYDLLRGIEWVRKPVGGDTVYTEVFNQYGALLAAGNEIIYNPGNLEWFQNIELTALNTMAVQSRGIANGNGLITQEFQNFTPLVQYHKHGQWKYYREWNPEKVTSGESNWMSEFDENYHHFMNDFHNVSSYFKDVSVLNTIDSIHAEFTNGHLLNFNGFESENSSYHYVFKYHQKIVFSTYKINERRIYQPLASAGVLDETGAKIGKWSYFDRLGNLSKETTYYKRERIPSLYSESRKDSFWN